MERKQLGSGEAALERLLRRVDAAVDEYTKTRRSRGRTSDRRLGTDEDDDELEVYWDAWWALPLTVRNWLLWYVPNWWALGPGAFRRLLLTTANVIMRDGVLPRTALQRAAAQLRLPPPQPRARLAGNTPRRTSAPARPVPARRRTLGSRAAALRRTQSTARPRRRQSRGRFGGFRSMRMR